MKKKISILFIILIINGISTTLLIGQSIGFNIIEIPNSTLIDNTTRPSLYNGTIAWHDGTNNGDLFYWDGNNTNTVATGCFGGEISLYDGKIAFQHFEGVNNGTRVYYWDGNSVSNISGNLWAGWLSLYSGEIAFSGAINGNHELYLWDGLNTTQLTTTTQQCSPVPSLFNSEIAYIFCGELFYWNGTQTTLIYDNSYVDWKPSLYNGQIAFAASDGNDYEIFLWNGSNIIQITNDNVDDKKPSLFNGQIAWTKGNSDLTKEIYFWDGSTTTQVTNNSIYDNYPSLYNGNIAWNGGAGWQGTGNIYYATQYNIPPSVPVSIWSILLSIILILASILFKRLYTVVR